MKTIKIKKVLIALDYDPTAQKVAESGYAMAEAMEAEVTLLHVVIDLARYSTIYPSMGVWQVQPSDVLGAYNKENAGSLSFLEKAKKHLGDKSIQIEIREGDAAIMILETAAEMKADCIVVGSHSQKWLENILLGSVAEEVLRKTKLPMYIIPTRKQA